MSLAKSDLMWEKMTVSSLLIWDVEAKTVGEILYYPPPPIRPASSQVTAILGHKWRPCLNLSTKLPPWQCFARRWLDQHLIRAHFGSGQCDVSLWQNTGVGVNRVPMSLRSSLKLLDKWRLYRFVWVCPSLLSRKSFALKGNPATPEQNAFLLGKIRKLQIQKIVTKTCLIRKYSVWICVEKAILFLQTMNLLKPQQQQIACKSRCTLTGVSRHQNCFQWAGWASFGWNWICRSVLCMVGKGEFCQNCHRSWSLCN